MAGDRDLGPYAHDLEIGTDQEGGAGILVAARHKGDVEQLGRAVATGTGAKSDVDESKAAKQP